MNVEERKKQSNLHEEPDLKGTMVSVSILGLFLLVTWIGAFALFLSR